jgi:truncated hemoglobin YjbI
MWRITNVYERIETEEMKKVMHRFYYLLLVEERESIQRIFFLQIVRFYFFRKSRAISFLEHLSFLKKCKESIKNKWNYSLNPKKSLS